MCKAVNHEEGNRHRWLQWLFEARQRFGLEVLNYMVTSNHIHLIFFDNEGGEVIPKSMQLLAGRTAQQYNERKRRKGAFWQDRYHATAIESGEHLARCLIYVDLNMVRAGMASLLYLRLVYYKKEACDRRRCRDLI